MIQLKIGTNTKRNTVVVSEDISPKEALEDADIDYSMATVHLDGAALSANEMNMTFAEHGITEKATLICVVKATNA